jgi:hypothetical protein
MKRNIRIASALTLAALLSVAAALPAFADSPLLSGYGGPGAGEQAIVGATLLGGPHGGAGSGGPSRSNSNGADTTATVGSSSYPGATNGGTGAGRPSKAAPTGAGLNPSKANHADAGRSGSSQIAAPAYVYPHALASTHDDSSVIEISSDDVFPMIAIVGALALIGALTVRLVRLQP